MIPSRAVLRVLDTDEFGVTYLVEHQDLGRLEGARVLNPLGVEAEARFRNETQALVNLRHPNIVQVRDFGMTDEAKPYIVTEPVSGGNLFTRLGDVPLTSWEAAFIGRRLVSALAAGHRLGLLHHAVRPDKILFRGDEPMLADFGIGGYAEPTPAPGDASDDEAGRRARLYQSPEQLRGQTLDTRSDLCSFGLCLVAMTKGPAGVAAFRQAPSLDGVDPGLASLILSLTDQISERPRSAEEVGERLGQLLEVLPVQRSKRPVATAPPSGRDGLVASASARPVQSTAEDLQRSIDVGVASNPAIVHLPESTPAPPLPTAPPVPELPAATLRAPQAVEPSSPSLPVAQSGPPTQPATRLDRPTGPPPPVQAHWSAPAPSFSGPPLLSDPSHIVQPVPPAEPMAKPAAKSKHILVMAGAAVLVIAAVGIGVVTLFGGSGKNNTTSAVSDGSQTTTAGAAPPASTGAAPATSATVLGATVKPGTGVPSGKRMVAIPGGTYKVGTPTPEADSSETIVASAVVGAFNIDAKEVSNEDYRDFVSSTQAAPPLSWTRGKFPAELATRPVQGVNFEWASAYCASLSKRLPSEVEWEVAASGPKQLLYPWGPDAGAVALPLEGTYPVGSIEGNKSEFGVYDMAGSVWEWVADSYDKRVKPNEHVLRGGQNGYLRKNVTRLPVDPKVSNAVTIAGFRCAASTVDPNGVVEFGTYDHPPDPVAPIPPQLAPGVLIKDDFRDSTTSWKEASGAAFRFGYHPNQYFHLETKVPGNPTTEARAMAPVVPAAGKLIDVKASAFVENSLTDPVGNLEFGLTFAAEGDGSGLVFVVSPRKGEWRIMSRSATGKFEPIKEAQGGRAIPESVSLEVRQMAPNVWRFYIGSNFVTEKTIPGYSGNRAGMVLIAYGDNKKTHIHFESFEMAEH